MRFEYKLDPHKLALFLGIVSLYLTIQSLMGEYIMENILSSESDSIIISLIDLFSVNAEGSMPTWYSSLLLFFSAVLLAYIATVKQRSQEHYRYHWMGLAIIFCYLSLDEAAAIHEILSDPLQTLFNTSGYLSFGWLIVFVPLVIIFAVIYLRFLFHLPLRVRNLVIVAGSLYVGGAVIVEAISANRWSLDGGVSFPYLAIATVEEMFEMLGVIVFIFALLSYIVTFNYTAVVNFSGSNQTESAEAALSQTNRFQSWKWVLVGVIVVILGMNVGLYLWAASQPRQVAVDPRTMPFYQTVTDRYGEQGIIILGLNEVLEPDNPNAPQIATSLLTLFNDVTVVNLPAAQTSIAFASQSLPFDANELTEIVHQSGEDEFTVLDTSDVRAVADNNLTAP